MSSETSTLPAGWATILDEVHRRLDHAIALADTRIAHLTHLELDSFADQHRQAIAQWNVRLQRLHDFLQSTEQVVQSVDEILQQEESSLRGHLTKSATVRQKLAESTGRAIG
ncbi:MAG: hypothetical protein HY289_13570 [Planctomycetes bacterium]|nr:hypothetical protein [Planctomycetota bacterium]